MGWRYRRFCCILCGMAHRRRKKVTEPELTGFKYFQHLVPLLARLHDVGCGRDTAGNRQLHFDQYCLLILLYFFNPVVESLRGLQQASTLRKVQKLLGCSRASLGSLSEAVQVFEPERLREILGEIADKLPPVTRDSRLAELDRVVTLVDGTLLAALPRIAALAYDAQPAKKSAGRLHTQFEILKGTPARMDLTDPSNRGAANEKAVLRSHLEPGRCYVTDRGYEQFSLFNAIAAVGSDYVCRVREDHAFTPQEERPLSAADVAAGVIYDAVGHLGSPKSKRIEHPDHPVRLVQVRLTQHPKRGLGNQETTVLMLATNLLDVPAELIGVLYHYRWAIELFFRFFKHVLGCRHLLSHDPVGIQIQTYCAIIACMLITLATGRKPSLRTYEMVCYYFSGMAEEDELLAHIERLPKQNLQTI
jgi:Transposase DDE domain